MVDPGESPEQAAARELLEETGYRAGRLQALGSVNPNPALFGNRLFAFAAHACERIAEVANEGSEETVVELVAPAALRRLLREGRIDHGLVMAALYFFDLAREREGDEA
jgi:8-oxo-dGTP pyrophosphatase MutT (NUDIX family)